MASETSNDFAGTKCAISGWGKLGGTYVSLGEGMIWYKSVYME